MPAEDVKGWCDGLRKGYTDLQAANAVLMGALNKIHSLVYNKLKAPEIEIYYITKQALSTTPTQAAERVNAVVEALEQIISSEKELKECPECMGKGKVDYIPGDLYCDEETCRKCNGKRSILRDDMLHVQTAKAALAKYHGKEM